MVKKSGLGKGIGSLFPTEEALTAENGVLELSLTQIEPNKNQPRKTFDNEKLEILADSIKQHGLIQPIIVTKNGSDKYTIVAGERRWRAAKKAGLKKIPAVIREYSDQTVTEVALIENLQREDLNPIEEALGYKDLVTTYGLTQEEISQKVGKSRSAVANSMRLLSLEPELRVHLISGAISEGHARAALSLDGFVLREFLINRIIEDGLNVRQAEKLAKDLQKPTAEPKQKAVSAYDIELERIQSDLEVRLGTKVTISHSKKKGKIEIEYYGNDDLERILTMLK